MYGNSVAIEIHTASNKYWVVGLDMPSSYTQNMRLQSTDFCKCNVISSSKNNDVLHFDLIYECIWMAVILHFPGLMCDRKVGKQRSMQIWLVFDSYWTWPPFLNQHARPSSHWPSFPDCAASKVYINDHAVPDTRIWNEALRETWGVSV